MYSGKALGKDSENLGLVPSWPLFDLAEFLEA